MRWDYFISHASEDKLAIAEPLATFLVKLGFTVWYDEFSLKVGDSLLQSIEGGLSKSKFGITILSRNFFSKKWPKSELSGLFALENDTVRILPVWHNITASEVASYSPIVADRFAVSSGKGLQAVAEALVSASFPKRAKDFPFRTDPRKLPRSSYKEAENDYEKARKSFRLLLDNGHSDADLKAFLSVNQSVLLGPYGWGSAVVPGFILPDGIDVDFAILKPQGVTGPIDIELVILESLDRQEGVSMMERIAERLGPRLRRKLGAPSRFVRKPANYHGGALLGEFQKLATLGTAMQKLTSSDNIHFETPETWILEVTVYSGRRPSQVISDEVVMAVGMEDIGLDIATYDRLADDEHPQTRY